jgi:glycosyltransferase involved in cell wall biosynthesis
MKFFVISCGLNCEKFVDDWYSSLYSQTEEWEAFVRDDGSSDATFGKLERLAKEDPRIHASRTKANLGAAKSRWDLIQEISGPGVAVQLDLDDYLRRDAFSIVAPYYEQGFKMTLGGWARHKGIGGGHPRWYTPEQIDDNSFLEDKNFKAPPLRTFHTSLLPHLKESHFVLDNKWLRVCTDVALMFPLLKVLSSSEIANIQDPIYIYRKRSPIRGSNRHPKGVIFKKLKEKHGKVSD